MSEKSISNCHTVDAKKWRKFLLGYLHRGEISLAGAAWIAGVRRQTVFYWCIQAGISIKEAELARLVELRRRGRVWMLKEASANHGAMAKKKKTKKQLREEAIASKIAWDLKQERKAAAKARAKQTTMAEYW